MVMPPYFNSAVAPGHAPPPYMWGPPQVLSLANTSDAHNNMLIIYDGHQHVNLSPHLHLYFLTYSGFADCRLLLHICNQQPLMLVVKRLVKVKLKKNIWK